MTQFGPRSTRLLETGFGQLPTALRSELLDRISAGPPQNLVEHEKRWYRESKGEDPPAEHMLEWADLWMLDHLWPLRDHDLPVQVRDQLDPADDSVWGSGAAAAGSHL